MRGRVPGDSKCGISTKAMVPRSATANVLVRAHRFVELRGGHVTDRHSIGARTLHHR